MVKKMHVVTSQITLVFDSFSSAEATWKISDSDGLILV